MGEVKIIVNEFLESGTIMVSKDIWQILKNQYGQEALDNKFLESLGVKNK